MKLQSACAKTAEERQRKSDSKCSRIRIASELSKDLSVHMTAARHYSEKCKGNAVHRCYCIEAKPAYNMYEIVMNIE